MLLSSSTIVRIVIFAAGVTMVSAAAEDEMKPGSHDPAVDQIRISFPDDAVLEAPKIGKGYYTLPLENVGNHHYLATVQLGTPPQDFKVIVDTNKPDLWVPSIDCTTPACKGHRRYDSSASSSFQSTGTEYEVIYHSDDPDVKHGVTGFVARDTLAMADLEVKQQEFAEIVGESMNDSPPFDGILGLGFDIAAIHNMVPPFYHVMAKYQLEAPIFAFYFGDIRNGDSDKSEVAFGRVNQDRYTGDLIKLPIFKHGAWEVQVDKITFGDVSIEFNAARASIDTASHWVSFPSKIASRLNEMIGPDIDNIPCEKRASLPNLTFTFSGHEFTITPEDYLIENGDKCVSGIASEDFDENGPTILIGNVFLRKWYSVFDFGDDTISFAPAKH